MDNNEVHWDLNPLRARFYLYMNCDYDKFLHFNKYLFEYTYMRG